MLSLKAQAVDSVDVHLKNKLTSWLTTNTRVASFMKFDGKNGWTTWDAQWKKQLEDDFVNLWLGRDVQNIADPMVNHVDYKKTVPSDMQDWPLSEYYNSDAWRFYVALIANSLVVEIRKDVNWSVINYTDVALDGLFNGKYIFERPFYWTYFYTRPDSYTSTVTTFVPTTPMRANRFNKENNILAASPIETVGNALQWARLNLRHFSFAPEDTTWKEAFWAHWGPNGMPSPILYAMNGTRRDGEITIEHHTAGCGGTTGFLMCSLRAYNIPVTNADYAIYDASH
jgi:hypothetical protein